MHFFFFHFHAVYLYSYRCSNIQTHSNRMGRIQSTVLCENLLKIMRPRRDYRQLRKILFKYRQPGFKLTTENYTKKLRIGSNMEQIEKQLELEKYEHLHTFHVNDLFNGTRLTIRVRHFPCAFERYI